MVSINVPSDKARAVIDAMELKQDVQLLRQEMFGVRTELKQEIENRFT